MSPAKLVGLLEAAANEYSDWHVRSYSGRGMYGAECVAVSVAAGEEVRLGVVLALMALSEVAAGDDPEGDLEKLAAAMAGARTDSMGRGVVVYWPAMAWPSSPAVGPDDEDAEFEEGSGR